MPEKRALPEDVAGANGRPNKRQKKDEEEKAIYHVGLSFFRGFTGFRDKQIQPWFGPNARSDAPLFGTGILSYVTICSFSSKDIKELSTQFQGQNERLLGRFKQLPKVLLNIVALFLWPMAVDKTVILHTDGIHAICACLGDQRCLECGRDCDKYRVHLCRESVSFSPLGLCL